jgi:phosphatidylinositol-3-phosphatase
MRYLTSFLAVVVGFGALQGNCFGSGPDRSASEIPQFEHVFVVVEENQSYDDVIGSTQDMPYFNSLARDYGVATNYYANAHPSVNNYFMMTAGRTAFSSLTTEFGFLANLHPAIVGGENVASILTDNNKTWKAYLEGLPKEGSLTSKDGGYVKRHDPFAFFETVVRGTPGHPQQLSNLVPFAPNFERDLQNRTFPNYSFVVPDIHDDGHDNAKTHREAGCGDHAALQQIDQWLSRNIRPLVEDADFKRSGLLIIVFDEACSRGSKADDRLDPKQPSLRGGGHIPALIISSKTKPGTTSDQLLHHESLLRLCLRALGIQKFPGAAATAPAVTGFFDP